MKYTGARIIFKDFETRTGRGTRSPKLITGTVTASAGLNYNPQN